MAARTPSVRVAERIEKAVLDGTFEDGFTRDIAIRYGVTIKQAHAALVRVAKRTADTDTPLHQMPTDDQGVKRSGVSGGVPHDYWEVW
jgi:hypothetical protein